MNRNTSLRPTKTVLLIIAVVFLSITIATVRQVRFAGYISVHTQLVAAVVIFGLNLLVAIGGLWTRFRLAWLIYLLLSIVCMVMEGSSTPLTAAWIFIKLAVRHL
jgi:lysylphosphatidylglycerol synthetase-like protein (DUF2156 family)